MVVWELMIRVQTGSVGSSGTRTLASRCSSFTTALISSATVSELAPNRIADAVMYLWYASRSPSLLAFR